MVEGTEQSVLKIKGGKYVTISKLKNGEVKLCAKDNQQAPTAYVQTRELNNKKQIAFIFKRTNSFYLPKVDGTKLMLDRIASSTIPPKSSFTESHWFEMINPKAGEYHYLQSVGSSQFLALDSNKSTVRLCAVMEEGVQVTARTTA